MANYDSYFEWFQTAISSMSDLIKQFTEFMKNFIESWKKRFVFTKYTGTEAEDI